MPMHGIGSRHPKPDSLSSPANKNPGLFGKLFNLQPLEASDDALLELAKAMKDLARADSKIPAGFTYLGQFIDHDITFDPTSLSEKIADPQGKENFRTPTADLDSLYGLGQDGSPFLYERDPVGLHIGPKLLIGTAAESAKIVSAGTIPDQVGHDLPRSPVTGMAIISDPRNDENLVVAQLHVALMNFHNKVVDKLQAEGVPSNEVFAKARELVTWHYQWIVLHEFLETITGERGVAERIMKAGRKHFRFAKFPFMPIEFAVAAYRFGHSMVRQGYSHNFVFRPGGATVATLPLLFDFTAKSGRIVGALQAPATPLPQPVLPSNWVIDWRRFFDFKTPPGTPNFEFNFAQPIDPFVVEALHTLPGVDPATPGAILPFRNLKRGVMMRLPSGQAVAKKMGLPALTPAEIGGGAKPDSVVARKHGFDKATPLWYYILKEAELKGSGEHLGPVGATIVAEVFVGLIQGNPASYLSATPKFKPSLGSTPGKFEMTDLLTFAGVVNPIGDA
jgi:hypothetical protein